MALCWLLLGTASTALAADVRSTAHNLAQNRSSVEADEVCVFCHTPQLPVGAQSRSGVSARPIWQTSLPADHAFVMYDDIGRRQFGKLAVGSQSIACLSCHDASQAFSITGSLSDHPFGVPYRGFSRGQVGASLNIGRQEGDRLTGEGFRAAQHLKSLDDFRLPSKGKIENRVVWWVSATGVNAVRSRSDLPLYARQAEKEAGASSDAGEDNQEVPYIECSSCHDPHVAKPLFLRVSNEGSKLCLTCHDK